MIVADVFRPISSAKNRNAIIIHIGDYDACPCIGEHVSSTGEIGTFRITTTSFSAGQLRIRFKLQK